MKKFIALLLILLMIPVYTFAAKSPTPEKFLPISNPELMYILAEKTDGWADVLKRLDKIKDETEGYILIEALNIGLDRKYQQVEWKLSIPILTEHEPFVLIIDSEAIVKQEIPTTNDGNVIVDFTDYEPGIYYICFYIKGA